VTVKLFVSVVCTDTVHGVLQPGPTDVRASAPGGTDSSRTVAVGGVDFRKSMDGIEEPQPASPRLAPAISITRRMIHRLLLRQAATVPARTIKGSPGARNVQLTTCSEKVNDGA